MKDIIIIHHNDTDGYASAFAAWLNFGEHADYYPVNYGFKVPININKLTKNHTIYLLDFSFPIDIMVKLAEKCDLMVIDHHITAINQFSSYPWFNKNNTVEKSGCVLTWEYFYSVSPIPKILLHIQDWDLWKFEIKGTKEFHTLAEVYKHDFIWWETISKIEDLGINSVDYKLGEAMWEHHNHSVKTLCETAWSGKFDGKDAIIVNAPYPFISDSCEFLLQKYQNIDIAISIAIRQGMVSVSLRSRKESGIDVSKMAQKFGGGGHVNASGFRVNMKDFSMFNM